MLITELLRQNAQQYPDEPAFVSIDTKNIVKGVDESYYNCRREISWKEFDDAANKVANFLIGLGVKKGSKVGIVMKNRLEYLALYFGIQRAGAISVQINFRFQAADLERSLKLTDIEVLAFDGSCRDVVCQIQPSFSEMKAFIAMDDAATDFSMPWADVMKSSASDPGVVLKPSDDAVIYFSSGTTGAPKAVVHTHATVEAAVLTEHGNHHQVHEDCFVLIPPLYHMGGMFHWFGNLLCGAKCVLMLGFCPDVFLDVLNKENVTIAFLLLPWIQDVLSRFRELNLQNSANSTYPKWKLLHTGAQAIPPTAIHQVKKVFPNLECQISYGLTESGAPGCINLSGDRLDKLGSVGVPQHGWQAKVADGNGNEVAAGLNGELYLKCDHMMRCYYKDPDSTEKALSGGWLHTGDVARMDEDGFFYIDGRIKDIVISGGENVYPVPIETFLRTHPAIKDAAVFGIPDERMGEAVVAKVSLEVGMSCTEAELLAFCLQLPKYKRPHRIFFGNVPRNATGKIDKVSLRRQYAQEQ